MKSFPMEKDKVYLVIELDPSDNSSILYEEQKGQYSLSEEDIITIMEALLKKIKAGAESLPSSSSPETNLPN